MEHRVLIVAGSNPEERIKQYSTLLEVEPYIVYRSDDAGKLKQLRLAQLRSMLESDDDLPFDETFIQCRIQELVDESDEDFYDVLTYNYEHDEDNNAISRLNPDGKFVQCFVGGSFSQPFMLKDETTAYKAKKKDIMWEAIHQNKEMVNLYERTWEMCVEGLEPVSDIDKQVYENMKNRQDYFDNFKDKEEYVASCTSFWAYAFMNQADMWFDADDCPVSQFEWMSTFYDRFIKNLPDDTELTIFEYVTD